MLSRRLSTWAGHGRRLVLGVAAILGTGLPLHAQSAPGSLPRLRVSENTRFLVTADGRPFFWLGDTAWELFHRLTREEAERYLRNRAERRFTVIQAVALAELDGLDDPNPYGERPLIDHDPTRPNERYFQHVDWIVAKANALGLYVGLLPTWGDKWNKKWGVGPEIFTPENAATYGEWLGRRYRDAGIVWILGGDRPVETDAHRAIIAAMARGLRAGDGGAHLITFHPTGGQSSVRPVPRRGVARLQHAAERPRRRVHRTLRPDARRLRPHADQAGPRRRADLRGPSDRLQAEGARPLDRRRRAAPALLGPVQRRLRPHLRPSLGVADVAARAEADQRSAAAVERGDRPARRGADAARAGAARVAALPHPDPRRPT